MARATRIDGFLSAFSSAGSWYDDTAFSLETIEGMGVGLIASRELEIDTALFRIPLGCILSEDSSELSKHLSADQWTALDRGWARLILTMMWEQSRGESSPYAYYLNSMPTCFDTPMHWSSEEQKMLTGTSIEHRIGRHEADEIYSQTILPIIEQCPSVFPPSEHFSLAAYHMQGSRILSRSFTLSGDTNDNDSDSDDGDATIVAMVPLADILNAARDRDNAHLVYEVVNGQPAYTMITTAPIPKDKQIFNTYSSPPDAELLRKYGHIELDSRLGQGSLDRLDEELLSDWPYGNDYDEVDIDGASILALAEQQRGLVLAERMSWWIEEAEQEECFWVSLEHGVDDALTSFAQLLYSDETWRKAVRKGEMRVPLSKLEAGATKLLIKVFRDRLARYPNDLQQDVSVAKSACPLRAKYAAVVRIGEQRALSAGLQSLCAHVDGAVSQGPAKKKARR